MLWNTNVSMRRSIVGIICQHWICQYNAALPGMSHGHQQLCALEFLLRACCPILEIVLSTPTPVTLPQLIPCYSNSRYSLWNSNSVQTSMPTRVLISRNTRLISGLLETCYMKQCCCWHLTLHWMRVFHIYPGMPQKQKREYQRITINWHRLQFK